MSNDYTSEIVKGYWEWLPKTLQGSALKPDQCLCYHIFLNPIQDDQRFEQVQKLMDKLDRDLHLLGYKRDRDYVCKWSKGID